MKPLMWHFRAIPWKAAYGPQLIEIVFSLHEQAQSNWACNIFQFCRVGLFLGIFIFSILLIHTALPCWPCFFSYSLNDDIVLLMLVLTNDNAPFCVGCNENYTVKHFLLECHDFSQARNRFYYVNSLKELFNTIPSKT
jgi:hypothetical protein